MESHGDQVLGERPVPQITPEQQAALAASRRERRLDEILGLPAQPPAAPTGSALATTSCLLHSIANDTFDLCKATTLQGALIGILQGSICTVKLAVAKASSQRCCTTLWTSMHLTRCAVNCTSTQPCSRSATVLKHGPCTKCTHSMKGLMTVCNFVLLSPTKHVLHHAGEPANLGSGARANEEESGAGGGDSCASARA